MAAAHVEYVGFTSSNNAREYRLRVKLGPDSHEFILAIKNEAFLARRVRYQDGPGVCFFKLQKELADCADGLPALHLDVSDAELEEYRAAHTPKPPQRRPKVPPVT